ncbi:hypothetical protein R84B8_02205 [Treponema sp. R8-4-B8]
MKSLAYTLLDVINLKLLTWNIDFWQRYNKVKNWKENIAKYLSNLDYDFILLQESNPSVIFNNDSNHFELNNKMIYFKKLLNEEIGAKDNKNIIPWGNTIIANKKYTFIKDNFLTKNGKIENYYFGKSAFMCFDFKFNKKENITIMNIYNKSQNGYYPMLKYIISDIEKIIKKKKDNIIILAGDFNSDKERDPNNKIFVNKHYSNNSMCKLVNNTTFELSDHRLIECIMTNPIDISTDVGKVMFK